MKPYLISIHIFRRDLRLYNNTALIAALEQSEKVVPVFIFDPRQLSNPYKGNNAFEFMVNSLIDLDKQLQQNGSRLYFFRGIAHEVVPEIMKTVKAEAVFANRDYTPFSRDRDRAIAEACQNANVPFNLFADALLNEPEQVQKNDGKPYSVFTPFMKKAKVLEVRKPDDKMPVNYYVEGIESPSRFDDPCSLIENSNPGLRLKGGRNEGLRLLDNMSNLASYETERDLPSVQGTSLLSAHHKFGTVSICETYHRVKDLYSKGHPLINELYWRDFFTHIVFHFPHVFKGAFREKYDGIPWENDRDKFENWCRGQTGFPIVDAGMRELTTTGFMHNRVRMIVASFLVKDLHIDWRWGERFFANYLIDYDPAVNNGNWQWAASTGCDAQPYFRIFNPWSQQKKLDQDCIYVKKWVPELRDFSEKEIHGLENQQVFLNAYPVPMINHKQEAQVSKNIFRLMK
ncbi:MAG: DNA photolyase family protein [Prolixibacteraceae bacterium]|nr:DNA photolyase family protein [Prolixibacteraceae bacterium]